MPGFCAMNDELKNVAAAKTRVEADQPTVPYGATFRAAEQLAEQVQPPNMIGRLLGQYRIQSKLGEGGMGAVYLAHDEVLRRPVAVKVLQTGLLHDPVAKTRFFREARTIAALSHPSITMVYQAGEQDSTSYLAMEYVTGHTLREELSRGPIGAARLLRFAIQLSSALEHAHSRGVLHRDIKPANVMLPAGEQIKLLDFGIAKVLTPSDTTDNSQPLTASGTWVGTLLYAAPEVISGHPASFKSDVYSLGVLLYEMACGQNPFSEMAPSSLTAAILQGKVEPLSVRNPAMPSSIATVIRRAMAPHPDDRYATAGELLDALQRCSLSNDKASPPDSGCLVVLDFQNLSGDGGMNWLGTGIAETLISDLKKVKPLQVVSPDRVQASLRALGAADAAALGERLGAHWVVSGSYQLAGTRLRITPRILSVSTGEVAATGKVDGAYEDIFGLQDRVAQEVVAALRMQVDSSTMERILAPDTRHLQAYEAYAQARVHFNRFGKTSLEDARQLFERAVQLDPDYAMAHSGIGAAYCMRYIHRSDSADLCRAVSHLERARELDHELAEPYPWLCYAYMRQAKLQEAIAAGQRGVELQPDLVTAHYFLATAYTIGSQLRPELYQPAADELIAALRLDPQWLPTWLVLADIAVLNGMYDIAEHCGREMLKRAAGGGGVQPFPGAETLLANAAFRIGEWTRALQHCREATQSLSGIDHMYREMLLAVTSCISGDCHIRLGQAESALVEFRRAWQMVGEFPRMLGKDRVKLRAACGLALAYAVADDAERAQEWRTSIEELLPLLIAHPESWVFDSSIAQLWQHAAIAFLRGGQRERAVEMVEQAYRFGERDIRWLNSDPEYEPIRSEPRFQAVLRQIEGASPLKVSLPA